MWKNSSMKQDDSVVYSLSISIVFSYRLHVSKVTKGSMPIKKFTLLIHYSKRKQSKFSCRLNRGTKPVDGPLGRSLHERVCRCPIDWSDVDGETGFGRLIDSVDASEQIMTDTTSDAREIDRRAWKITAAGINIHSDRVVSFCSRPTVDGWDASTCTARQWLCNTYGGGDSQQYYEHDGIHFTNCFKEKCVDIIYGS